MILMACRVIVSFAFDILTSAGATHSTLWLNLGWAIVLIPALYYGTNHGGIRGTALSHAVVGLVVAVPLATILLERVGVRLSGVFRRLIRPGLAAVLCAGVCAALAFTMSAAPWLELLVAGGVALAVYVVAAAPPKLRADLVVRVANLRRSRPPASAAGGAHRAG
jgi:PST family polysaccharide transporter